GLIWHIPVSSTPFSREEETSVKIWYQSGFRPGSDPGRREDQLVCLAIGEDVTHPSSSITTGHCHWRRATVAGGSPDVTVNRDEVTRTRIGTTTFATTNHHGHRSTPPPAANHWGDSSHVTGLCDECVGPERSGLATHTNTGAREI
ncbi:unnamed protein product, partial [Brassica oleracea var. botrytis]